MSTSTAQGRAVTGEPGAPRGGTGARVVRGLGATLLLLALVVGIPVGLWLLGGPIWTGPVSLDRVVSLLSSPDVTGSVLIGLIKIVGWIAWLTFAIAVVIEVVAALRGHRSPHVRGLGAQQRAAAVLVGAVITMLVAAPSVSPAMAAPVPVELGETGTVATAPVSSETATLAGGATGAATGATERRAAADEAPAPTYTVQPGDSLWRIAEQTLGDGARFKQIADLNYGVPQADGSALDAGNWIEPGWVLRLPAEAADGAVVPTSTTGTDGDEPVGLGPSKGDDDAGETVDVTNSRSGTAEVVVESGDTLWGIAEEELGDGTKYPEVFEASRATEQPGGARLTDPDLILPGWTVTVPGAEPARGDGAKDEGAKDEGTRGDDAEQGTPGGADESTSEGESADTGAEQGGGAGADAEQPGGAEAGAGQSDSGSDAATPEAEGTGDDAAAEAAGAARIGQRAPAKEPAPEPAAPSAEVTPEGAVEPEDIKEPGGAGNDVVEEQTPTDEQPAGEQPAREQPAGQAPAGDEPNRSGQNAAPRETSARGEDARQDGGDRENSGRDDAGREDAGREGADKPDPADAATGTAGIGRPGGSDAGSGSGDKEPRPEQTAEGNLVPEPAPAPQEPTGPQYDEVTPEDLENDPDLEQDQSAPRGSSLDETVPGSGLIADELMPQEPTEGQSDEKSAEERPAGDKPAGEEPAAEETSSGSGTTWGSDPASDDVVTGNELEGVIEEPAELVPETEVEPTSVGGAGAAGIADSAGAGADDVRPEEIAGDEPVVEQTAPEVAVESSPPVAASAEAPEPAEAGAAERDPAESGSDTMASGPTATATVAAGGGSLLDSATDVVSDLADDIEESVGVRTAAGVGGLLAAGLLALVAVKRRRVRKGREPGETVVVPGPETPAGVLERDLHAVEDPFGRDQVDRALRSLAVWHRERGLPLPGVRIARLKSNEFVELYLDRASELPEPWASTTDRFIWQLAAGDADAAAQVGSARPAGAEDGEAPYPALVTVGHDDEDAHLMLDLENLACLDIRGTDAAAQATLAALAVELATSLWADDLQVTVVGTLGELPGVVDTGRVRHVAGLAEILRELEARAADVDRTLAQVGAASVAEARGRGLATDAWTPEILLVGERLGLTDRARLENLVERVPGVGIAAVTSSAEVGDWVLDLTGDLTNGDTTRGILMPAYIAVRPQQLDAATYAQALALLAEPETAPGPEWSRSIDRTEPTLEEIPVESVRAGAADSDVAVGEAASLAPSPAYAGGAVGGTTTHGAQPESFSPWARAAVSVATPPLGTPVVGGPASGAAEPAPAEEPAVVEPPIVRVLGDVELAGTTGVELPSTHQRQATELIAFLAFNPGSRGSDISKALWPSREPNLATRRSAVSRARRWLGTDQNGFEYLPRYWSADDGGQADLESAGYRLRGVATDWHKFCDLVGSDLTQTPTPDLLAALDMVRGKPFEGVPLRKYAWAEQLMHTISSGVVDVSHEVARRALLAGDVAMARHASQVGRLADPVDERSWRNGIRAEIASGRRDAVGRLVDRLRDHLEQLAMDPEPDTEELLAQVDEQDRRRERAGG
ncbi:LysM peptidoglycan-binding domain-containing protein [Promicromonospora sp. NPDC057488]|uniref:LysM peptidoglycan-binding domain-containing protein n=1 Tax=Promicromonospora sp. NPDC057488 TaxID=3346147 RepID=UPI00366B0F01